MTLPTEPTIGERVARARIARGITQETLAGLVGRSPGWVSKIERGVLPLDRKSVVLKLADVLDVDATTLQGRSQAPDIPGKHGQAVVVGELRQALMRWATPAISPARTSPRHTLDMLRQRVDAANRQRQDARFADLAVSLPALLDDLRDAADADSPDPGGVQTLAAEAMHNARAMTKKLGHLDLAWMSAELAGHAARRTDDPLLAAANAWNHIEVYKAANAPGPARALALATIDELAEGLGTATPGHLSLWGTMHLQAGLIAAYWSNRDDAAAHLREAADAARRLGGDGNYYDTMFGTTNVAIHHVAVAVELGDAQSAINHATPIDASNLGRERRARLAIDLARALEHAHKHQQALASLLKAEKLAPDYVRPHPLVREIVSAQLRRAKPELRSLAKRMGVM
ncbi:MAG: helix-turn-helix domain-containing protein [Sciscionella sp.]